MAGLLSHVVTRISTATIIMKPNANAVWTVSSAASERAGFDIGNTYTHTNPTGSENEKEPWLAFWSWRTMPGL